MESSLDDMIHYYSLKLTGNKQIKGHTWGSFLEAKKSNNILPYDIMKDPFMRKYTYKALNKK